jgi:hypothetical protein
MNQFVWWKSGVVQLELQIDTRIRGKIQEKIRLITNLE